MVVQVSRSGEAGRRPPLGRRTADDPTGSHTCGPPAQSNATLIARCIEGEFGAWNELVTRYERLVYAIPLREGLNSDDAADVSQAAFETLVQSLDRIREPERLGHWLMTVTRRLAWRRRTARQAEVNVDAAILEAAIEPAGEEWERTVEVYDAILGLGDPCRALIFGLFFDPAEPSYHDLARTLGMAVGSIGPLRGRCLSQLRSLLEDGAG